MGEYTIAVNSITAEGDLLSEQNWYLVIIYSWLAAIFVYASAQLFFMQLRNRRNQNLIDELSEKNTLLRSETDRFRKLSTVDALTNIYNRFGVDQVINSLNGDDSGKTRASVPYSLIVIDIDHFKRVNDNHGHDVGDMVLRGVADCIKIMLARSTLLHAGAGKSSSLCYPIPAQTKALQ